MKILDKVNNTVRDDLRVEMKRGSEDEEGKTAESEDGAEGRDEEI